MARLQLKDNLVVVVVVDPEGCKNKLRKEARMALVLRMDEAIMQ